MLRAVPPYNRATFRLILNIMYHSQAQHTPDDKHKSTLFILHLLLAGMIRPMSGHTIARLAK